MSARLRASGTVSECGRLLSASFCFPTHRPPLVIDPSLEFPSVGSPREVCRVLRVSIPGLVSRAPRGNAISECRRF